jgi:hypothetical protein
MIADLYTPPSRNAARACGHEHLPENSIENWEVVLWYKMLITYPCKYVMLLLNKCILNLRASPAVLSM